MGEAEKVLLQTKPLRYYSQYDEAAFFEWLDKLACVTKYEGRGDTLFKEVQPALVDEAALRELLALFFRYNFDLKQFAVFDREGSFGMVSQ